MASLARAGRLLSRAGAFSAQSIPFAASREAESSACALASQHVRGMASGHGPSIEYKGVKLHEPARWHVYWGEGLAALMWFWVFVRAYHDGSTLLFGHAQHFEHELHEEHEHSEPKEEHH